MTRTTVSTAERRAPARGAVESSQKADLVVEKPDTIHAVFERIVIERQRFVGLRLTPGRVPARICARAARGCDGAPDRIRARGCHNYPHPN